VALQKLTSTDAFVVTDLPDAPASGVVRRAKKILQSSANDLARSATYTFGAFGIERGGASAGINAMDDGAADALAAFVEELTPTVASGQLHLDAGKGVRADELAGLRAASALGPSAGSELVLTTGITTAARWALGGDLNGKTVAIEGADQAPGSLRNAMVEAGATVVDVWGVNEKPWLVWGAEVDAILAGSRPGTLTHQGAGYVTARAIVPWGPIPVTTKAFVQLRRAGVTVLPDFVAIAGSLVGGLGDGDEADIAATVAEQITEVLDQAGSHPDGVLLGACYRAEDFIATWHDTKPFGRPLAA
jgi:glutamate dehydrogenase/leucine dehydrogenase